MSADIQVRDVSIPDATAEPAAYVRALLEVLGDRDPLTVLARTPSEVERLVSEHGLERLNSSPGAGEWSFRDVLGHLLDVDIVYGFRLRLALTADMPTYPGYDEKGFSQLSKLDVSGLVLAFRGLRTANMALLESLTEEQLDRRGVHGEQGPEDVRLMVHKLAGHDLAHLQQMERAAAAAGGTALTKADAERLLRAAERAFASQDLDAISALFAADVVARYAGTPVIHGKAQLRRHLGERLRRQVGYEPRKTLVSVDGDVVIDSWEGSWTDAETGKRMAGRGMEALRISDGVVVELDAVFQSWPEA